MGFSLVRESFKSTNKTNQRCEKWMGSGLRFNKSNAKIYEFAPPKHLETIPFLCNYLKKPIALVFLIWFIFNRSIRWEAKHLMSYYKWFSNSDGSLDLFNEMHKCLVIELTRRCKRCPSVILNRKRGSCSSDRADWDIWPSIWVKIPRSWHGHLARLSSWAKTDWNWRFVPSRILGRGWRNTFTLEVNRWVRTWKTDRRGCWF